MSPRHWRYLLVEQGIGSGVFNVVFNAAIAWAMFRGATTVPLWGQSSIGGDTLGTAVILPLLTTLISSRIVRRQVRTGHVPAMAWPAAPLGRMPRGLVSRGVILGAACLVVAGIPTIQALAAADVGSMGFGDFVVFKALFAGVLATAVTPVVARLALADAR